MKKVLLALFLLPMMIFAGISGTYDVTGFNFDSSFSYTAVLTIEKQGDIYTADWLFSDNSTSHGTGIRQEDSIAFIFNEGDLNGVQLYAIDGCSLKGPWVFYDEEPKGYEVAKKVDCHCDHCHHHHSSSSSSSH